MTDTIKLSAIDKALAAAKARKAAKDASASSEPAVAMAKPVKAELAKGKKSPSTDDEAKAERKATREANKANKLSKLEAERADRRGARAAAKAEKLAALQALNDNKKPAHMKKVEKAGAKLPKLNDQAAVIFSDIISNFDAATIASISLHLQHHNRVAATERARNVRIEQGDLVRIIGGDPRFIGLTGIVDRSQRIRCYVEIEGRKPIYLFTSDVELITRSDDTVKPSKTMNG